MKTKTSVDLTKTAKFVSLISKVLLNGGLFMNRFLRYLFIILLFPISNLNGFSIFGGQEHLNKEQERNLKKMNYFLQLGEAAITTGEQKSYSKVPGIIADLALTDLICKTVKKYSGVKKRKWVVPLLPFMVITGKKLLTTLIYGCKIGAYCKSDLQKRYGRFRWLSYFSLGVLAPYVIRECITESCFENVCKKFNLQDVTYPQWILNRSVLTLLAWYLHMGFLNVIGNGIESLYSCFVPQTSTEKYLCLKNRLAVEE